MTPKQAMQLIVDNCDVPALNYAVNYAKAGLKMPEFSEDFRVQCIYIVGNITNWRPSKKGTATAEQIKEARKALKIAGGMKY